MSAHLINLPKGLRLDQLVISRGLLPTRETARTAIMDGAVLVNGQKATKPGMNVSESAIIELVPGFGPPKFASRGGLKLEKGLEEFSIAVDGRICLDIGASTGGFTDCLLKRGAKKVYAIDVGYGQLDWSLRNDPRVVVKERFNARNLKTEDLYSSEDQLADFAVMDVSFISIKKILPAILAVTTNDQNLEVVCLVKPQFEAGRHAVGKGGVIKSPATHVEVLTEICEFARTLKLSAMGLTHSPIKGPAGNIEFLLYLRKEVEPGHIDLAQIVERAHEQLA